MPDYSKGKVYQIVNSVDDEMYVGSTIGFLSDRLYDHQYDSKRRTSKVYKHLNNIGW